MTLKEAIKILSDAGIESAGYDAREIFSVIGGVSKSELVLSNIECKEMAVIDAINRRAKREPLQYIIGNLDFYRENYLVSPACLIPRADTEILVDYAVKNLPSGARFADLCTGSGCIAISTLKNTKDTTAVAMDISRDALDLARKNATRNRVFERIEFIEADVLERVAEPIFAMLSNPPYVSESAYSALEAEIYHEPKIAFVGGEDGGDFYRRLTEIYSNVIDKKGFIAYEIGYDQGEMLKKIAKDNHMSCEIIKDLGGNDRVAVLKK
jgi:release factor glutamine methyltransferase